MKKITKPIALILLSISTLSCSDEVKAEAQNKTSANQNQAAPQKVQTDKSNKLGEFEQEIQKMLGGAKGDENILRDFLRRKPEIENVLYVKKGIDTYVISNGKRPEKQSIVDTLAKIKFVYFDEVQKDAQKRIESKLVDQLEAEKAK